MSSTPTPKLLQAQLKVKVIPTSRSVDTPLTTSTNCIAGKSCNLTASNLAALAAKSVVHPNVGTIDVSGQDLAQYMLVPSEDTPLERFLKEENKLHRLASSPWLARVTKL